MSPTALRLGVMMFLQFFIWGAWYVTAPRYLGTIGFTAADFGWTYSVGPIAGILSPFIVGMIADRFFSTERVLAVLHLAGGGLMFLAISMMGSESPSPDTINLVFFGYMLCYFPTLALTNSLAMHNIENSEKEFPLVRVFGTVGWIIAGIVITIVGWNTGTGELAFQSLFAGEKAADFIGWDSTTGMFQLAAMTSVLMGLYCLTLPHTPPPSKGKKVTAWELFGFDALVLLKRPSFLVFMISSFLICIPLAFYYQMAERTVAQSGIENPAFKMTFGQMSEIFFMLVMPLFFARLGVKWMLFVGMLAWVVRYGLFALGAPDGVAWMLLTGVILHGICYDFFFVTGQIYTDKAAPPSIRGQAQGMLVLFTLGLGMLIGAQVAGRVEAHYTPQASKDFAKQAEAESSNLAELRKQLETAPEGEGAQLAEQIATKEAEVKSLNMQALQAINWKAIWTIPAIGAGVIMIFFALVFKDTTADPTVTEGEVADAASQTENP